MEAVSFAKMKSINRHLVLDLVRKEGPISRADIAKRTGLASSAIANVVTDLMELELVCEAGVAPSGGGRPPTLVSFNASSGYVVGVNVGYSDTVAVITDLSGSVLHSHSIPTGPDRGWDQVRPRVARLVRGLIDQAQVDRKRVRGVGVGIAGWVDSSQGISLFSPNFGWRNISVRSELSDAMGLPVWIDNDVRMAAWGEWRQGAGRGTQNFACILVGSAIGAGFVVDGHIYHGAHQTAGEIGHTVIDPDGPRCGCGKYGCLESLASGRAIAAHAMSSLKRGRSSTLWKATGGDVERITGSMVGEHAARGDGLSIEVLEQSGRYLGAALALMVNLVNPDRIAVGGGVAAAGELVMGPLRDTFRRQAVGYAGDQTDIVRTQLGKISGPIGAAERVIDEVLGLGNIAALLGKARH